MEMKWLIPLLILGLIGCSAQPVRVETEVVEINKPILYCPPVDFERVSRPATLPINNITAETTDGEVVVFYKASIKALIDYTVRLELMLDEYNTFSKSYEDLVEELKANKK